MNEIRSDDAGSGGGGNGRLRSIFRSPGRIFSNSEHRSSTFSREYVTVMILFSINLLNYMDRYTIAAVLTDVQAYYRITDVTVGLLQTVFICSYMVFAPICGYLGDRYSRKLIMITGIFVWSTTVLISSFVPRNLFWLFFILRGVVGIGEASYSTISPVIIADLFTGEKRTKMLMVFYFAIPIGSGLGYVVGANVAAALGCWQWGIRLTPIFGAVCIFVLLFLMTEPVRGAADKGSHLRASTWLEDLHYLSKNRSFVLSSLGFVCIAFVTGGVSWWMPTLMIYSQPNSEKSIINLKFGLITCISGFLGVSIGSLWAARWQKTNKRANPLICAIGLLLCVPFYFIGLIIINKISWLSWMFVFVAIMCLCLNWAVLQDLLLHVVVPPRRSTANAVQITVGHLLGDASSPYIIGYISDLIASGSFSETKHFLSLRNALFMPSFFLVLGGCFFLYCSLFVEQDRQTVIAVLTKSSLDNDYRIIDNNGTSRTSGYDYTEADALLDFAEHGDNSVGGITVDGVERSS